MIPRSPLAGFRPPARIFWLANQDSQQRLSEPITFECFGTNFNCYVALPESAAGQTKLPQVNNLQDLNVARWLKTSVETRWGRISKLAQSLSCISSYKNRTIQQFNRTILRLLAWSKMPSRVEDYEELFTIGSGSYGKCRKIRRKSDGKVSKLNSSLTTETPAK